MSAAIRANSLPGLIFLLIILAVTVGYDYYKVFAWPEVSATVVSVRQTCEYSKSSGRYGGRNREYPICDDGEEPARLLADGYELEDVRRLRIEALYEAEPGRNTSVPVDSSIKNAAGIGPNSTIKIRVSSGRAELAARPNSAWALLLGGFAVLVGVYAYINR
jgi:hypothetical protein